MANEWTDELKESVIEAYCSRNPTPENTIEILKEVAEEFDKTPNGVRMILTKAGVYVKKAATSEGKEKSTSTRVSKADAIEALRKVIEEKGAEVDDNILSKLTGKAAVYFRNIIEGI